MQISSKHIAAKITIFTIITVLLLSLLTFAAVPAHVSQGTTMKDFKKQQEIDMVFIGSSHVIYGVNPDIVDERLGVKSFNLGSGAQSMTATYYLLKEVFEKHSPEFVFIDVYWNRLVDRDSMGTIIPFITMPFSVNKLDYLINGFESNYYLSAVFPGVLYPRMLMPSNLMTNLKAKFSYDYRNNIYIVPKTGANEGLTYISKGHHTRYSSITPGNVGKPSLYVYDEPQLKFDEESIEHFGKIVELCRKNGAQPVAFVTPVTLAALMEATDDYAAYTTQIEEIVSRSGVEYFDFNLSQPDFFETLDWYYADHTHLCNIGAEAFTSAFAEFIADYIDGSLVRSSYLFDSFDELLAANPRILCTWMEKDVHGKELRAFSHTGTGVEPEYRFLVRQTDEHDFVILQDYGAGDCVEIPALSNNRYVFRVEARVNGSLADFEQYYELTLLL